MTRRLSLAEVLELHRIAIERFGGAHGVRDVDALHSAVMQPYLTFGGQDLYSQLTEKAAALCFSLVMNHPFIDGNNRVGHAAMEALLLLNGFEISAATDVQESIVLSLAAGELSRESFVAWVDSHTAPFNESSPS